MCDILIDIEIIQYLFSNEPNFVINLINSSKIVHINYVKVINRAGHAMH